MAEKRTDTYDYAKEIIKEYGNHLAYDLATWILYQLNLEDFCIWQTYTKDDIETNLGRKTDAEEMEEMQENLANCFEYIRLED